VFQWQV